MKTSGLIKKLFFIFIWIWLVMMTYENSYAQVISRTEKKSISNKYNTKNSLILSPLQQGSRYVRSRDTQLSWQNYNNFSIGAQVGQHLIFLDHGKFVDSSGNQTLSFRKERTELLLSYRYLFYSLAEHLDLGIGFGLGVHEDAVKSRLGAEEVSEKSGNQTLTVGLVSLSGTWKYLFYSAEIQSLSGRDYEPQPMLTGLARIGLQFTIFE